MHIWGCSPLKSLMVFLRGAALIIVSTPAGTEGKNFREIHGYRARPECRKDDVEENGVTSVHSLVILLGLKGIGPTERPA